MLNKDTLIKVKNSTNTRVGYLIPELSNLQRHFASGETKEIEFGELEKLSFIPGGRPLLKQYLTIENPEALRILVGDVEPEYFYTENDIKEILLSGTVEQLMDFLDFAPEGMVNLAKDLAVSMEINDIRKRDAIKSKTNFDVTRAIQINHEVASELEEEKEEVKTRRSTPINQKPLAPKYKVTSEI